MHTVPSLFRPTRNMTVTGQLADTPTRGLDDSRTGQLADATGDFACLVFVLLVASAIPRVVQSATCPVRELAYPRVVHAVTDAAAVTQRDLQSRESVSVARTILTSHFHASR